MGKRRRGPGTAQRRKEREMGLHLAGVSKPMLDAMNAESKARFQLGIGVLVQEEERERRKAHSLRVELEDTALPFRWLRFGLRRQVRRAWAEHEVWARRLREVSQHVADNASAQEVARFQAQR